MRVFKMDFEKNALGKSSGAKLLIEKTSHAEEKVSGSSWPGSTRGMIYSEGAGGDDFREKQRKNSSRLPYGRRDRRGVDLLTTRQEKPYKRGTYGGGRIVTLNSREFARSRGQKSLAHSWQTGWGGDFCCRAWAEKGRTVPHREGAFTEESMG